MKTKKFDAGGLTGSGGAKGALDQVGQSLDQISNALNGGQKSSFGFAPNASPGLPGPNTSPGLPTATEAMNKLSPGSTFKKGGKVASASKRGDGIAQRGKTRGRYM